MGRGRWKGEEWGGKESKERNGGEGKIGDRRGQCSSNKKA